MRKHNKQIPSGWTYVALGEMGTFSKGQGITKAELKEQGLPCIRYGEIYTRHDFKVKQFYSFIDEKTAKSSKKLNYNDLLFAGSGETLADIGKSVSYQMNDVVYAGGDIIILNIPTTYRADYISYYINSIGRKYLNKLGAGNSVVHIYAKDLKGISILLPPLDVQRAIADMLDVWDRAIEKTDVLIQAKEKRFGWLQNHLIDNNFKLYKSRLEEFSDVAKLENVTNIEGLKPLTVSLHCKGIKANERDFQIVLSDKGRSYHKRYANDFLIGRQNFHNGGFGIVPNSLNGFIASSAITTLDIDNNKLDTEYLFYFFSRSIYYKRIGHIMDGTGQKELSDKHIRGLPISVPNLKKQKEIVLILNTARSEITLLKKLATQYRSQKQGLMQKLLTGTWGVSV